MSEALSFSDVHSFMTRCTPSGTTGFGRTTDLATTSRRRSTGRPAADVRKNERRTERQRR